MSVSWYFSPFLVRFSQFQSVPVRSGPFLTLHEPLFKPHIYGDMGDFIGNLPSVVWYLGNQWINEWMPYMYCSHCQSGKLREYACTDLFVHKHLKYRPAISWYSPRQRVMTEWSPLSHYHFLESMFLQVKVSFLGGWEGRWRYKAGKKNLVIMMKFIPLEVRT